MITDNVINNSLSCFKSYLFSSNLLNNYHHYNNRGNYDNIKILVLFKVKSINNQYRTISYMQTINFKDFDLLNKLFIEYWNLRDEDYYLAQFSHIVFTYKLISENDITVKIQKPSSVNKTKINKIDCFIKNTS